MRVVLFEDELVGDMTPIALTRPVFELLAGCMTVRERTLAVSRPDEWGALIRPELVSVFAETPAPQGWGTAAPTSINDPLALRSGSTLLVNGRWLTPADGFAACSPDNVGVVDDQIAWLQIDDAEAGLLDRDNWNDVIPQIARTRSRVPAGGHLVRYPWDLLTHNEALLRADLQESGNGDGLTGVTILGPADQVSIDPSAEVDPFVLIDARNGPVRIAAEAKIQAFTRIAGPCSIGWGSQVFRGLIHAGTTIGPMCRVGGEIEASILHGYVNKYHEGFLGHSYVCPWVNLGAMTTTSDLKNDYSGVRVPLDGTPIESGETKVGCFIGDHTKTAIDSMFNTGSSIGVMSVVLPNGELLPRFVPSFACVWHGHLQDSWDLERSLDTARVAMSRRGCQLTDAQVELLRCLYDRTADTRTAAVRRFDERLRASRTPSHRS